MQWRAFSPYQPVVCACRAAAVLAVVSLLQANAAAAPVRGEASATVANGFARFVFNLSEQVDAEVRQGNGIVVIEFAKPIDIAVEQLPTNTADYVSVARRDPNGGAVRLGLKRKVTVHSMAAGERLYVDLLPEGWVGLPPALPKEVVEDLARRTREAERKLREQQKAARKRETRIVRVRTAAQPTFTRYSFELPAEVGATSERSKDTLRLIFDTNLTFELSDATANLPPSIAQIESESSDTMSAVKFTLIGKADARTFREDNSFVLDITLPENGERAAIPAAVTEQADTVAGKPTEKEPRKPGAVEEKSAPAQVPATQVPPAQANRPAVSLASTGQPAIAAIKQQGGIIRLVFPFTKATPAAVFSRGDALWLVFDTGEPLDLDRLRQAGGSGVQSVESYQSGESQVVRLKLARPRLSSMEADGTNWVVTVADSILEPTSPLALTRSLGDAGNASARIEFAEPHKMHRLSDPDVGDSLIAITALGPARGFLKVQDLVEFRALASIHGVVLQPLAEDLSVWLGRDAILLSRPGGLSLTAAAIPALPGTAKGSQTTALDLQSWGFDRQTDFRERQSALLQAIAEAPEDKRLAPRLEAARFYLARELYAEAGAVATLALADERDDAARAPALMLRAIASIMLGHYQDGLQDLANPLVADNRDAAPWRALAQAGQGNWKDARTGFADLEAAGALLPLEMQRQALLASMRASIESGDFAEAARRLNEFDGLGASPELVPRLTLLKGRIAEGLGRLSDAVAAYALAAQSADREAAAKASLRLTGLRLRMKEESRPQAITALETLSAIWRGDATEAETLGLLSVLYTEEQRHRDAFQVVRTATAAHPKSALTQKIQSQATSTFDDIFLGDRGASLSAIEALGLFYDFSEFTPVGRRGDEMIRRLAERLVEVDLLNQAAELLQHQIENRLQGAARSQVATRLATVHLLNRKPERALAVLRATRLTDLPRDLRQQRMLLEARGLSETGRHDLALELVSGVEGREADRLRAHIYWQARRWRSAAEHIETMYDQRWQAFTPLDDTERMDVMRAAVSYALAEDVLGLDRFRQKFAAKMAEGPERRIFEIVTAPVKPATEEFREAAKIVSAADTLRAFLKDMKARFPEPASGSAAVPQSRG